MEASHRPREGFRLFNYYIQVLDGFRLIFLLMLNARGSPDSLEIKKFLKILVESILYSFNIFKVHIPAADAKLSIILGARDRKSMK